MTTKEKVEDYLGIDISSALDSAVSAWISWATKYIENYTKRKFASAEYAEEYEGSGLNYLNLKQYPVTELTKVERNTNTVADPVWEDITEYCYLKADEGQIYKSGGFFARERHYKITYTAGYAEIPTDIEWVATKLVADIVSRQSAAAKDIKKETLGESSYEVFESKNISPDIKMILDLYRTPTLC